MHVHLVRHPDTPATIRSVEAELTMRGADAVRLAFYVTPGAALAVPASAAAERTDGLWQRTCFELFLKPAGGEAYFEFNLSPSSQWAAYAFDGYRSRAADPESGTPRIELERQGETFVLETDVDLAAVRTDVMQIGLSAVIEEAGGAKSYWALRHPPGKPDFHHPDCFALELPAASAP